ESESRSQIHQCAQFSFGIATVARKSQCLAEESERVVGAARTVKSIVQRLCEMTRCCGRCLVGCVECDVQQEIQRLGEESIRIVLGEGNMVHLGPWCATDRSSR